MLWLAVTVPVCSRFYVRRANSDKINTYGGVQDLSRPRSRGTPSLSGTGLCGRAQWRFLAYLALSWYRAPGCSLTDAGQTAAKTIAKTREAVMSRVKKYTYNLKPSAVVVSVVNEKVNLFEGKASWPGVSILFLQRNLQCQSTMCMPLLNAMFLRSFTRIHFSWHFNCLSTSFSQIIKTMSKLQLKIHVRFKSLVSQMKSNRI